MEQKTKTAPDNELWKPGGALLNLLAAHLPGYLMRQRWYPAKSAGIPDVALSTLIPFSGAPHSALTIWKVTSPGGDSHRLFVPVALFNSQDAALNDTARIAEFRNGDVVGDALASDDFVREFVHAVMQGQELKGESAAALQIRRSAAEQSNTSIRIGVGAMLKVIRKLVAGVHPELEMGRYLTPRLEANAIPALLGWMDLDGCTLALLQSFISNDGDGWVWTLEQLQSGNSDQIAATLPWIRTLAKRTAEMHLALGEPSEDPAFTSEPATRDDWAHWMRETVAMAEKVSAAVVSDHTLADLRERCAHIEDTLTALIPASQISKTRHHGDYHLGQVLVHDNDVTIVDFEGEPLRSLQERRAKHVALRDVAGMLRSFAYVAAVAQANDWLASASTTFLDAYLQTLPRRNGAETSDAKNIVRFFSIEKALYEVLYEMANRPTWANIPIRSLMTLFDNQMTDHEPADPARVLRRAHVLPQGAELQPDGATLFRIWAPGCAEIRIALYGAADAERLLPMKSASDGWYELSIPGCPAGTLYHFVLPDGTRVPDPASRYQPQDVHGPSETIDPGAYAWKDGSWAGRPWHEAVLYEVHIGAFTPAGTFLAAIERLDHLVSLGITALEIMPVADFPGSRNWGYDGVLLFAPDSSYGRPEDFKALIDAAHARGLMVILDVVYNHFGPDGNYLPVYAPAFFTDRHNTPWGAAVNYDGPHSKPVREFVIHNALYWVEEYHLDGLRLDAVHAIIDDGPKHVLDELAERVRKAPRPIHLILENEENEATRLMRDSAGIPLSFTAQWNDDVHHVLHVAVSGEKQGYYADYAGDSQKLGRALAEGFAFQGDMMEFRGEPRGEPSAMLPPTAFVAFIQNHDQIGNRAFGDRLTGIARPAAIRAIAAVYLLLPQIPMLFMGEEWGAVQPFPFFCDFDGDLAEAVRKGRRAEFAKFPEFQDESKRSRIPDPQAESTFASAKLEWNDLSKPIHAKWHDHYRRLLAIRRETIIPLLPSLRGHSAQAEVLGKGAVAVRWSLGAGGALMLVANLRDRPTAAVLPASGRALWQEGTIGGEGFMDPWFVRWTIT